MAVDVGRIGSPDNLLDFGNQVPITGTRHPAFHQKPIVCLFKSGRPDQLQRHFCHSLFAQPLPAKDQGTDSARCRNDPGCPTSHHGHLLPCCRPPVGQDRTPLSYNPWNDHVYFRVGGLFISERGYTNLDNCIASGLGWIRLCPFFVPQHEYHHECR